jgi:hypothetical protein
MRTPGITGIELGPDYCVLVKAGRDGSKTTIAASRTLAVSGGVSSEPGRFVDELRRAREDETLPPLARVVAWAAPADSSGPQQLSDVAPLRAAGFEIDAIVSPAQALARLVNARRIDSSRNAVAAVSLNRHGVAITIVSRGDAVSSRVFEWPLGRPFTGARDELLDRYLVVSQVAPHLQHLIDLVRPVYGATVTSVLVCGNLPNLRSLSMLFVAELDIEVETLDSEDLVASADAFGDVAVASLQLASAASLPGGQPFQEPPAVEKPNRTTLSTPLRHTSVAAAFVLAGVWALLEVGGFSPATPLFPDGIALAAATSASAPASASASIPPVPNLRPEATMGRVAEEAPPPVITPRASRPAAAPAAPAPEEAPPLPSVDGIMIGGDRRLAVIGGKIVAPGDAVGVRTLVRIDKSGVVLREPSGREVYVAIRTRR